MDDFLTFKHSFNSGDLVASLPGLQYQYNRTGKKFIVYQMLNLPANYDHSNNHPIKDDAGRQVCMNKKTFDFLKPLIESQDYVEKFEVWQGEDVDVNADLTRHNSQVPLAGGLLHYLLFFVYPQLECNLSDKWINVENHSYFADKIIINRTGRYNNPYIDYFFLKDYQKDLLFAGLEEEREKFCNDFNLDIPLLKIKDFLQLAVTINSCRFFIGGQSLCWHIADAMKKKRILELCASFPNTFPTGKDGYAFVLQKSFINRFEKLLKETE